ncbi:MAG: hypothetical protein V4592_23835 [Bacteroidota bacterium]
MSWDSVAISICLLLAAFAVYREYARGNKAHLIGRIIAVVLAISALACVILPLTYSTTVTETRGAGKILLTDGFHPDSLNKTDSVYTLDKAVHRQYPKAKLLDNVQHLFTDSAHISPVHIYGYGLNQDELAQLSGHQVIFHPSSIPDGFTAATWTEQVKTGQQFAVQGSYKNTSAKACELVLKGLNTTLDSVVIPARSQTSFAFKSTPKNNGRSVYSLIVLNGKDTLQQEHLPLIIEKTQPLKVLMLSASPDFETKFLKNWLGGNGYGVASRTTITKGKFGQEYFNMDQPDLSHLTAGLLSKFDIVIGDLSVLKNLSAPENSALQQEISKKGMGLIIRADSSDKKASWLQSAFPINYQAGKQAVLSALTLQGKSKTVKLNIDPVSIIAQSNTQPLITDEHGHLLSAITLNGAGKLIFTTINNTYNWALAGNQDDYAALWSLLIDKAARKLPVTENWSMDTNLPVVNSPVQLVSESVLPLGDVKVNQSVAYPAQNSAVLFQRAVTYWPESYGWQQVIQYNGAPYWWYVWKKDAWQSITAAKRIALTGEYANAHPAKALVTEQIQQKTRAGVPKIYFYMLFLMAATFLWAESKFFS